MTTSTVRSVPQSKNSAAVARLSKAYERAFIAVLAKSFERAFIDGADEVELPISLTLPWDQAATLIQIAREDADNCGGDLEENLRHYIHDALLDKIVEARNKASENFCRRN